MNIVKKIALFAAVACLSVPALEAKDTFIEGRGNKAETEIAPAMPETKGRMRGYYENVKITAGQVYETAKRHKGKIAATVAISAAVSLLAYQYYLAYQAGDVKQMSDIVAVAKKKGTAAYDQFAALVKGLRERYASSAKLPAWLGGATPTLAPAPRRMSNSGFGYAGYEGGDRTAQEPQEPQKKFGEFGHGLQKMQQGKAYVGEKLRGAGRDVVRTYREKHGLGRPSK